MKKTLTIVKYVVVCVLLLIAGILTYVKTMLPNVKDAPQMKVSMTPDRIERGKYLANNVMVCMDCHSSRDWSKFAGPPKAGTMGMGGEVFDQNLGFPGKFIAPNITPFALNQWTDGEIFRAITTGVNKDGKALFPVMPHISYGKLDKTDIEAVVAYLRILAPIEHQTAPSSPDFPMNFIINTIPSEAQFSKIPEDKNSVAYGNYLVTAGACFDCHTKQEKGKFVGEPFAGGFEFKLPDGSVTTSANLTPHSSGIGNWTEAQFIQRFKVYTNPDYKAPQVAPGEFQTPMPWMMYAGMSKEDLAAIYKFLRTLEPKKNEIVRFKSARS
ncbi:c-type cytochrome [Flavobacterium silvisoli]|uniref:C-type cytochrome n=1 Tax=Flavobacterium silvisoli TaxID=2529433 RepID=A0A4Q9Z233_9FLAO|nr:c-type cytochrome [Flavobacterium silvisoli]TBX70363.1 c-type cytochrome [Flavobacterium silvisoli]